jgi:hypothetical protein
MATDVSRIDIVRRMGLGPVNLQKVPSTMSQGILFEGESDCADSIRDRITSIRTDRRGEATDIIHRGNRGE